MLHSAVIEVRQHLCCANVFLKFQQSLVNFESLKISVEEHKVKLQNPKNSAEIIVDYFTILAGTFSNLIVDAENASFRISIKDIELSQISDCAKRESLKINLKEQNDASVKCGNCEAVLVAAQKYDKIREFPSGAIDVNEFFCHNAPSYKDILVPSLTDLFYGFQFIILNRENMGNCIREKEHHLYCSRCLKYLGETIFNGKAAKIWSDTICFEDKQQLKEIFPGDDDKIQIYKLLLKAIEETSLPLSEPLLRNMHFTKVLLMTTFPNRQLQFLMIHILEKHLPVLRNIEKITNETQQKTCFELKQYKAFKILYRLLGTNENSSEAESNCWPPILEYWQEDINILKMKISPNLFSCLHEELNNNTKVLPKIYRSNNDEFLLSYIFY